MRTIFSILAVVMLNSCAPHTIFYKPTDYLSIHLREEGVPPSDTNYYYSISTLDSELVKVNCQLYSNPYLKRVTLNMYDLKKDELTDVFLIINGEKCIPVINYDNGVNHIVKEFKVRDRNWKDPDQITVLYKKNNNPLKIDFFYNPKNWRDTDPSNVLKNQE